MTISNELRNDSLFTILNIREYQTVYLIDAKYLSDTCNIVSAITPFSMIYCEKSNEIEVGKQYDLILKAINEKSPNTLASDIKLMYNNTTIPTKPGVIVYEALNLVGRCITP